MTSTMTRTTTDDWYEKLIWAVCLDEMNTKVLRFETEVEYIN